jgi:hypothetical protein
VREFDRLTQYAKDKVMATETPLNLYKRAQLKKNAIDTLMTVVVASVVLAFSTTQLDSKASIQSPTVKKFLQQEMVASTTNP